MKLVSLFTGAGGLDLGLEVAGFKPAVCVEKDESCVTTLERNRDWTVIQREISSVSSEDLKDAARISRDEMDLVAAGPPCQPFSKSAYWATGDTERLDDPRASTLEHFLRVIRDLLPRVFLLENVPGLGYSDKDEGLRRLKQVVKDINADRGTSYVLHVQLLNAAEYGVPQGRERLFVVAQRDGADFNFPDRTHTSASAEGDDQLSLDEKEPFRTAWDAIGDLDPDSGDRELEVTGKWADLLPSIPEGSNYLYHTPQGDGLPLFGWRRRFWNFLLKLSKRRPSWTITAQPGSATGPFHWKSRRLSMREMARLQTFPDDYDVVGSLREAQRQIGNAVPSVLGERLGWAIRKQLLGDKHEAPEISPLAPPRRTPVPPPEQPGPVPEKYHSRIADHDPHPGEGKGPGARAKTESG